MPFEVHKVLKGMIYDEGNSRMTYSFLLAAKDGNVIRQCDAVMFPEIVYGNIPKII